MQTDALAEVPPMDKQLSARATDEAMLVHVVGAWRRGLAWLVDLAILTPVFALAAYVGAHVAGVDLAALGKVRIETVLELIIQGNGAFFGFMALIALIGWLYNLLFTATTGYTPGLRLLRSRVIDLYGDKPSGWRALLRCTAFPISFLLIGLGVLWIAFDHEKRGLHDRIAGTYVIRR